MENPPKQKDGKQNAQQQDNQTKTGVNNEHEENLREMDDTLQSINDNASDNIQSISNSDDPQRQGISTEPVEKQSTEQKVEEPTNVEAGGDEISEGGKVKIGGLSNPPDNPIQPGEKAEGGEDGKTSVNNGGSSDAADGTVPPVDGEGGKEVSKTEDKTEKEEDTGADTDNKTDEEESSKEKEEGTKEDKETKKEVKEESSGLESLLKEVEEEEKEEKQEQAGAKDQTPKESEKVKADTIPKEKGSGDGSNEGSSPKQKKKGSEGEDEEEDGGDSSPKEKQKGSGGDTAPKEKGSGGDTAPKEKGSGSDSENATEETDQQDQAAEQEGAESEGLAGGISVKKKELSPEEEKAEKAKGLAYQWGLQTGRSVAYGKDLTKGNIDIAANPPSSQEVTKDDFKTDLNTFRNERLDKAFNVGKEVAGEQADQAKFEEKFKSKYMQGYNQGYFEGGHIKNKEANKAKEASKSDPVYIEGQELGMKMGVDRANNKVAATAVDEAKKKGIEDAGEKGELFKKGFGYAYNVGYMKGRQGLAKKKQSKGADHDAGSAVGFKIGLKTGAQQGVSVVKAQEIAIAGLQSEGVLDKTSTTVSGIVSSVESGNRADGKPNEGALKITDSAKHKAGVMSGYNRGYMAGRWSIKKEAEKKKKERQTSEEFQLGLRVGRTYGTLSGQYGKGTKELEEGMSKNGVGALLTGRTRELILCKGYKSPVEDYNKNGLTGAEPTEDQKKKFKEGFFFGFNVGGYLKGRDNKRTSKLKAHEGNPKFQSGIDLAKAIVIATHEIGKRWPWYSKYSDALRLPLEDRKGHHNEAIKKGQEQLSEIKSSGKHKALLKVHDFNRQMLQTVSKAQSEVRMAAEGDEKQGTKDKKAFVAGYIRGYNVQLTATRAQKAKEQSNQTKGDNLSNKTAHGRGYLEGKQVGEKVFDLRKNGNLDANQKQELNQQIAATYKSAEAKDKEDPGFFKGYKFGYNGAYMAGMKGGKPEKKVNAEVKKAREAIAAEDKMSTEQKKQLEETLNIGYQTGEETWYNGSKGPKPLTKAQMNEANDKKIETDKREIDKAKDKNQQTFLEKKMAYYKKGYEAGKKEGSMRGESYYEGYQAAVSNQPKMPVKSKGEGNSGDQYEYDQGYKEGSKAGGFLAFSRAMEDANTLETTQKSIADKAGNIQEQFKPDISANVGEGSKFGYQQWYEGKAKGKTNSETEGEINKAKAPKLTEIKTAATDKAKGLGIVAENTTITALQGAFEEGIPIRKKAAIEEGSLYYSRYFEGWQFVKNREAGKEEKPADDKAFQDGVNEAEKAIKSGTFKEAFQKIEEQDARAEGEAAGKAAAYQKWQKIFYLAKGLPVPPKIEGQSIEMDRAGDWELSNVKVAETDNGAKIQEEAKSLIQNQVAHIANESMHYQQNLEKTLKEDVKREYEEYLQSLTEEGEQAEIDEEELQARINGALEKDTSIDAKYEAFFAAYSEAVEKAKEKVDKKDGENMLYLKGYRDGYEKASGKKLNREIPETTKADEGLKEYGQGRTKGFSAGMDNVAGLTNKEPTGLSPADQAITKKGKEDGESDGESAKTILDYNKNRAEKINTYDEQNAAIYGKAYDKAFFGKFAFKAGFYDGYLAANGKNAPKLTSSKELLGDPNAKAAAADASEEEKAAAKRIKLGEIETNLAAGREKALAFNKKGYEEGYTRGNENGQTDNMIGVFRPEMVDVAKHNLDAAKETAANAELDKLFKGVGKENPNAAALNSAINKGFSAGKEKGKVVVDPKKDPTKVQIDKNKACLESAVDWLKEQITTEASDLMRAEQTLSEPSNRLNAYNELLVHFDDIMSIETAAKKVGDGGDENSDKLALMVSGANGEMAGLIKNITQRLIRLISRGETGGDQEKEDKSDIKQLFKAERSSFQKQAEVWAVALNRFHEAYQKGVVVGEKEQRAEEGSLDTIEKIAKAKAKMDAAMGFVYDSKEDDVYLSDEVYDFLVELEDAYNAGKAEAEKEGKTGGDDFMGFVNSVEELNKEGDKLDMTKRYEMAAFTKLLETAFGAGISSSDSDPTVQYIEAALAVGTSKGFKTELDNIEASDANADWINQVKNREVFKKIFKEKAESKQKERYFNIFYTKAKEGNSAMGAYFKVANKAQGDPIKDAYLHIFSEMVKSETEIEKLVGVKVEASAGEIAELKEHLKDDPFFIEFGNSYMLKFGTKEERISAIELFDRTYFDERTKIYNQYFGMLLNTRQEKYNPYDGSYDVSSISSGLSGGAGNSDQSLVDQLDELMEGTKLRDFMPANIEITRSMQIHSELMAGKKIKVRELEELAEEKWHSLNELNSLNATDNDVLGSTEMTLADKKNRQAMLEVLVNEKQQQSLDLEAILNDSAKSAKEKNSASTKLGKLRPGLELDRTELIALIKEIENLEGSLLDLEGTLANDQIEMARLEKEMDEADAQIDQEGDNVKTEFQKNVGFTPKAGNTTKWSIIDFLQFEDIKSLDIAGKYAYDKDGSTIKGAGRFLIDENADTFEVANAAVKMVLGNGNNQTTLASGSFLFDHDDNFIRLTKGHIIIPRLEGGETERGNFSAVDIHTANVSFGIVGQLAGSTETTLKNGAEIQKEWSL